ncbi:MAG: hypothetical protein RLZZ111_2204 [Planctomycetota bacterium]|jgi:hypothetical protein
MSPTEPAAALPEIARAAVTVALGVYLVGLLLTMVGNTASGSSALVRTVKGRLFAPWMVPAWLDLGFDYPLATGGADAADHALEVGPQPPAAGRPARFPGSRTGTQAARWRRLARAVADADDDADRGGPLTAAIGRGLFGSLAAEDVAVRVVRRPTVDRGEPARAAETAYAARVRSRDGELQLLRSEPRVEVAPLVPPVVEQPR